MNALLNAYERLTEKENLPCLRAGGFQQEEPVTYAHWEALRSALATLDLAQGWLQCQSHQQLFCQGLPELQPEWGVLLHLEAIGGDGVTTEIRYQGEQGWLQYRLKDHADGDGFSDTVEHLAHGKKGKLRYQRYWHQDSEQGCIQVRSRFIGLTED